MSLFPSTAEGREKVVAALQDGCPLASITRPSFTECRYVVKATLPCGHCMTVEGWNDEPSVSVRVTRPDGSFRFDASLTPESFPDDLAFMLATM